AVAAGVPARLLRFQDMSFEAEFDGVWACASLLHVPRNEIGDVLRRLTPAVRPSGCLYASFKRGEGGLSRGGRLFNNYTQRSIEVLFASVPSLLLSRVWESTDLRPGRGNEVWVNALAMRQTAKQCLQHSG